MLFMIRVNKTFDSNHIHKTKIQKPLSVFDSSKALCDSNQTSLIQVMECCDSNHANRRKSCFLEIWLIQVNMFVIQIMTIQKQSLAIM